MQATTKDVPALENAAGDQQQARQMRLLAKPEVLNRLSVSNDTLYGLIRAGHLPKPVKIGVASRWPEHEIEAFIAGRLAEREATASAPPPNTSLHRYRQRQAHASAASEVV